MSPLEITELKPAETLVTTIRHGLTELNRDKRVGGRVDVALLDEGREQARQAAEAFAGQPVDVVMSSPLLRAIETAEIVTGWSRDQMEIDELCTERSFGSMEGMKPRDVPVLFPHVKYLHIEHIGYSLNPPGGETFDALHERAHVFAGGLLDRHSSKRIVVFSHQNFMQQLHGVLRGMDPYESLEHDVLNCELNEFKLGADRELMAHRRELLVPSAVEHSSF